MLFACLLIMSIPYSGKYLAHSACLLIAQCS